MLAPVMLDSAPKNRFLLCALAFLLVSCKVCDAETPSPKSVSPSSAASQTPPAQSASGTIAGEPSPSPASKSTVFDRAAWAPNGEAIAFYRYATIESQGSSAFDAKVRIWDLKAKKIIAVLENPESVFPVSYADWSPDASLFGITGTPSIHAYDAKTWAYLGQVSEGKSYGFGFAVGGKILTGGNVSGLLTAWDVASRKELWRVQLHDPVADYPHWVSFSADGTRAVAGSQDGGGQLLDGRTGKLLSKLGDISTVAMNREGSAFVANRLDGSLLFYKTRSVAKPRVLVAVPRGEEIAEDMRTGELLRSENGEYVAWVRQMCQPVLVFELGEGKKVKEIGMEQEREEGCEHLLDVAFSEDGKWLSLVRGDRLRLVAVEGSEAEKRFEGVRASGFRPGVLWVNTVQGEFLVYSLKDGGMKRLKVGQEVESVWPSPDGRQVLVLERGGGVSLIQVDSGQEMGVKVE